MHMCSLDNGQVGVCGARENQNGSIKPIYYGRITALALDPIEKKPLSMYMPGTNILSIGSLGCNLKCGFCQNHRIAAPKSDHVQMQSYTPKALADLAKSLEYKENIGIAYTYNEPLVSYEFVRDVALEVREQNMKNVVVTNGSFNPMVLDEILPYIDAFNIDLKGFSQQFYTWVGGSLQLVKDFISTASKKAYVEVTTLIVPGKNDSVIEMDELSSWLASVSPDIPLHISRFYPNHKMRGTPPTSISLMHLLQDTAAQNLKHVILGNV